MQQIIELKLVNGYLNLLWDNELVISGMEPIVSTDEGEYRLFTPIQKSTSEGYVIEYLHDDVSLSLKFQVCDGLVVCYVNVLCKKGLLTPVAGVKLRIADIRNIKGLMANYLHKNWWTRPWFNTDIGSLPPRTQSLFWSDAKRFYHLLPVCDDVFKAELMGVGQGMDIVISAYDVGYISCNTLVFVFGGDSQPYRLVKKVIDLAIKSRKMPGRNIEERHYPEIFEYLGWCSWDAFYHDVNEKGIIDKADEFKEKGIPVKWMIVDDGWSETRERKLWSFQADRGKFPNGLGNLVKNLKGQYGISWVGVWHTFTGYWDGIHPDSDIAKEYKDNIMKTKGGRLLPYPDAERGFPFWNAWHTYLKKQGVDFVKVDNQSALVLFVKNNMAIGTAACGMHGALEASVALNFNGWAINCMGMAAENMWNRRITAVSRSSDDFLPQDVSSFKEHAMQNAYNCFIYGNLIWGDWDMWWTYNKVAVNSAVLRAISGGPVYISDQVGKTDPAIIKPLILSNGRVLRCNRPGMPTMDCLVVDPQSSETVLKIWNRVGDAGVIAAFNVHADGRKLRGTIKPSDVPDLTGQQFAVYDHFTRTAYIKDADEVMGFELQDNGCALYLIVPFKGDFALLGLLDKYISPATIKVQHNTEREVHAVLYEGGLFGFVAKRQPDAVMVNGEKREWVCNESLCIVDCSDIHGEVFIMIR
ncbi:hypothetical protein JOD02_001820 [Caldicoprobacter guelmensis]|uniref:Sip1-related alpha-galactosidase n=1 Tax=Caldicoprobacter guelmensis TaxID=1170224 RepID=UPI00195AA217|nr:Sip1-related alpha-galactosidase [Caldicoprobacter guelmensis]MBM7582951.1 hypothetical protein [Caldicoprobacter guelmensis]